MKNILKRNQIIILVIALMLVSAGYLSYSGNKTEGELLETGTQIIAEDGTEYAGIGDAKLVSSNSVEGNTEQVAVVPNEEISNESTTDSNIVSSKNTVENNNEQEKQGETAISQDAETTASTTTTDTSEKSNNNTNASTNTAGNNSLNMTATTSKTNTTSKEVQEYFSSSRLNRETMYSQMLESYQKIMENQTISETQKSIAQTEIQNINATRNKIMICENLIKTKGFSDLIIFVNDKSISVVVRADTLEQEQIAQIQNIIAREMNVEVVDIHISNK